MFDCYDTVHAVLQVATGVMSTLKVRNVFVVFYKDFIKQMLNLSSRY